MLNSKNYLQKSNKYERSGFMSYIDEIISQCEELMKQNITSSSSEFKSWKNSKYSWVKR